MDAPRPTRKVRPLVVALPLLLVAALSVPSMLVPGGSDAKYSATLRAELLDFVAVQETYRSSHGRYAASIEDLWWHADTTPGFARFRAASGARIKVHDADSLGFAAFARIEPQGRNCWIFVGADRAQRAGEVSGVPNCNVGP